MDALQKELKHRGKAARLSSAVDDVEKIIELLSAARDQIAQASDPHTAGLTMARLQNPIKDGFEKVNQDLREVSKSQRNLGKALDKSLPLKPLPTDHDAMADHSDLINRAIAMHLLREGQFSVASTFIAESQDPESLSPSANNEAVAPPSNAYPYGFPFDDGDQAMVDDDDADEEPEQLHHEFSAFQSRRLQDKFAEMYLILQELKARNLVPAIEWARSNSDELEARGSNLEFELSKLQFVWLSKGPAVNGLPDDASNGWAGALAYSRQHFGRFQTRHLSEIQQLVTARVFASNLGESPYRAVFSIASAFSDVAASFTREFCSLLGLSAESPLYIAATAGALALPQLVKYTSAARAKGTEWTTTSELAFETPLPRRMLYHSIFVCPVSKEQTTEGNPPMMIPCGHVLGRETLQNLSKNNRFKCPYCPNEGHMKDARQIIL